MAETEASSSGEPKKGKLLLIVLPIMALLLLGGGGAGFAYFKKLGPFGKKVSAKEAEKPKAAKKASARIPAEAPATVRTLPPTTRMDPEEGAAKLAKLWNEIEAPKLLAIAQDWKDPELARVTSKMDPAKVSEVLAAMPPRRASSLSREMQRLASIIPIE